MSPTDSSFISVDKVDKEDNMNTNNHVDEKRLNKDILSSGFGCYECFCFRVLMFVFGGFDG